MTPVKRCWRPQGRFLREFARTGSVSAAVPVWHDGRIVDPVPQPDLRVRWRLLQALQAETYGPRAAELQARRERTAELRRRLDEAEERVAAYEAGLRAQAARNEAARNKEKSDDAG